MRHEEWNFLINNFSCCRKKTVEDVENNGKEEEEEDDEENERILPVWIAVSMLLIYLCFVSVGIWLGDQMAPQQTGFSSSVPSLPYPILVQIFHLLHHSISYLSP